MRRLLPPLLLLAALLTPLALRGLPPAAAQVQERVYLPLLSRPALVASYLGGPGADAVNAADLDAAGRLLLAGRWANGPIGGVSAATLPGGEGAVVRLAQGGAGVAAAARVGGTVVRDMEASAGGSVVACGDMGVVALSADLSAVAWRATPGDVARCSVGAGGGVAALVGAIIYRYGPDGAAAGTIAVAGTAVSDIAVDEASGLIFATGYTQKARDLKVAFLRAYGADNAVRWTAYDFPEAAVRGASLAADSEGRRVSVGTDGKLYFAGWTDGGNAIYGRDPQSITTTLGGGQLVKFDAYNDPYRLSGATSLAWYGRFEPATGRLLQGQWLLTRLSDGSGNSISVRAIDAAADGTIAIAGDTAYAIQGRVGMGFAGVTLGDYEGGEPYLLVVSPDMKTRRLWTALAAPGTSAGSSGANGVAIGGGVVAMGATLRPRAAAPQRGLVTTPGAVQPASASPSADEGYYLLMQVP